jgi:uncharacterized phiE125 gp8 family phage protein
MAYLKLVALPDDEPVQLDDVKKTLRVDSDDDDDRIERHIREAREWVERRVQRKIAAEMWEIGLDAFPIGPLLLPLSPVQSVESIKYDDASGTEQTVAPADYKMVVGSITAAAGWPTSGSSANAVRVRVLTGYEDEDLIPSVLISAIHLKVKELYDGEDVDLPIHRLLTNYYTMVA